jgi:hypothetical protein
LIHFSYIFFSSTIPGTVREKYNVSALPSTLAVSTHHHAPPVEQPIPIPSKPRRSMLDNELLAENLRRRYLRMKLKSQKIYFPPKLLNKIRVNNIYIFELFFYIF